MKPKEYFKLSAKTLDRQKTFFKSHDPAVLKESTKLEEAVLAEIVRVAQLDNEIHEFVMKECPYIAILLKTEEIKKQVEMNFDTEAV